ncbi:aromatic amino acid lyase [Kribbella sp. NBC_00359]|uniref:aromatic amino acid lyase n=1 Tax=Kribbella sp. NBC_00359 TaxID=2975966 RepID=UPI003FA55119
MAGTRHFSRHASGDLVPLRCVAGLLVAMETRCILGYASPAPAEAGLHPIEFQAKEALALVDDTSLMSRFAELPSTMQLRSRSSRNCASR